MKKRLNKLQFDALSADEQKNFRKIYLDENFNPGYLEDSVCGYTPLWVKENEIVDILPIEDLYKYKEDGRYIPSSPMEVLSSNGWTKVNYIYKHTTHKDIYRVRTKTGIIDVTEDHSLMQNGQKISPIELNCGDIIDVNNIMPTNNNNNCSFLDAWFSGLFAAEGTANEHTYKRHKKGYINPHKQNVCTARIGMLNREVIELVCSKYGLKLYKGVIGKNQKKPFYWAKFVGQGTNNLVRFLHTRFYTSGKQKKIPSDILNGNIQDAQLFLDGFFVGDGHITKHNHTNVVSYTTTSPTLAAGLCHLLKKTNKIFSINERKDKLAFNIRVNISDQHISGKGSTAHEHSFNEPTGYVREIYKRTHDKEIAVYDINTDNGTFITALGGIVAHNTDFCKRAKDAGFICAQVPYEDAASVQNGLWYGPFPMGHEAEATMHDKDCMPDWNAVKQKNTEYLKQKYSTQDPKPLKVLAAIPTKGRYYKTLLSTLIAILNQSRKPDYVLIADDNTKEDFISIPDDPTYRPVLDLFTRYGIGTWIAYGPQKGLAYNNEMCQNYAIANGFPVVWRLDDDVCPEPNVLETLLSKLKDDVGAVGGPILVPNETMPYSSFAIKVEDVGKLPNIQWTNKATEKEVEHLHCSFIYRPGIAHYNLELSPLSMTEETQLTHEIYRAGYKVIYTPDAVSWHFKQNSGGCRSYDHNERQNHDYNIFQRKLAEWGRGGYAPFEVYLENGIGDHIAFSMILDELIEKYGKIRIACTYPTVFRKWRHLVDLINLEASPLHGKPYNIYNKMMEWDWKGHIVDAYRTLYGLSTNPSYRAAFQEQDPSTYYEIFSFNAYEADSNKIGGKVVFDIGANRGFFTARAKELGATKVISIEPHPVMFSTLENNMLNFDNVYLVNAAVSDVDGEILHLSDEGTGSKVDDNGFEVPSITLHTLLENYAPTDTDMFLKLDCEGSEYNIILNTTTKDIRRFKYVACEVHIEMNMNPNYRGEHIILNKMKEFGFGIIDRKQEDPRMFTIVWGRI